MRKLSYDGPLANGKPMRRIRRRTPKSESHTLLYFAAGAVAGAAAGALLARRFRTRRDFLDAVRDKIGALREYWTAAALEDDGRHERDVVDAYEMDDELVGDEEVHDAVDAAAPAPLLARDAEVHDDDLLVDDDAHEVAAEHSGERALENRVLDAFEADAVLQTRAVDIAAVGASVIELSGWVRSLEEASRAASVARRVPGVSMVLNRLAIRGEGDVDTADVAPPAEPARAVEVVSPSESQGRGETPAS